MKDKCKRPIEMQLRALSHRIHRFIGNTPEKQEFDSVTSTNGWIIFYLSDHRDTDVFQKDIEKEFDITRSTASRVIDLMEQKGLIRRERVEHDGRLKKIVLTEKSEQLLNHFISCKQLLEDTLTKGFTQEEKTELSAYLMRMLNNLENKEE